MKLQMFRTGFYFALPLHMCLDWDSLSRQSGDCFLLMDYLEEAGGPFELVEILEANILEVF